jgi:hypothetical protein
MTALNMIDVVKGHPTLNAEAMRMLVYAAGHELEFVDTTAGRCEVRGRRAGRDRWQTVVWTIDDARQAGLAGGDNWKKYPRRMLQARASSELCKLVFPDVVHGFTSLEEVRDDLDADPGAPAAPPTKVTRTRKTAAKKSTPPLEERGERPAISGPPLPGEEGYQEQASAHSGGPPAPVEGADVETGTAPTGGRDGVTEEPAGEGAGEAPEPAGSEAEKIRADHGHPGLTCADAHPEVGSPKPPDSPLATPKARAMTRLQQRGIEAALTDIGVDNDREARHLIAGSILGRGIESFKELTVDDASKLIETLARIENKDQLTALLNELNAAAKRDIERWNKGDRS